MCVLKINYICTSAVLRRATLSGCSEIQRVEEKSFEDAVDLGYSIGKCKPVTKVL